MKKTVEKQKGFIITITYSIGDSCDKLKDEFVVKNNKPYKKLIKLLNNLTSVGDNNSVRLSEYNFKKALEAGEITQDECKILTETFYGEHEFKDASNNDDTITLREETEYTYLSFEEAKISKIKK